MKKQLPDVIGAMKGVGITKYLAFIVDAEGEILLNFNNLNNLEKLGAVEFMRCMFTSGIGGELVEQKKSPLVMVKPIIEPQ